MSIKKNKFNKDSFFMQLALQQAEINLGNTKNNPSVGCIIKKDQVIIGVGNTSINGRPHAEINAINNSKVNVKDSILYTTLEPCSNYGKTDPCVKEIIKKKISKVVFSIKDPDLKSFNKSTHKFKKKNIKVTNGVLSNKVSFFYESYIKQKNNSLPFVTCKLALSKDYYTINKEKKWITNKYSRGRVHLMRSKHDCIITSSKTIIEDDPLLTCRIEGLTNRSPSKIILDKNLSSPLNSKIFIKNSNCSTIIFYNKENKQKIKLLNNLNVKTYKIPLNHSGDLDLVKSLIKAKKLGFSRIFLESGINLVNSFLKNNLIDEFKIFITNFNLGSKGLGNFRNFFTLFFKNKKKQIEHVNLFNDTLLSYKLK